MEDLSGEIRTDNVEIFEDNQDGNSANKDKQKYISFKPENINSEVKDFKFNKVIKKFEEISDLKVEDVSVQKIWSTNKIKAPSRQKFGICFEFCRSSSESGVFITLYMFGAPMAIWEALILAPQHSYLAWNIVSVVLST